MKYAVMLGSNMFIGTSGILNVEGKEFFRIRKLQRERSSGAYIVIDCDIKDSKGEREIKLFKNKPVASDHNIDLEYSHEMTKVIREDGSKIIQIEKVERTDDSLPKSGPITEKLKQGEIDEILRITGDFFAGQYLLNINENTAKVGGITLSGNLMIGTGGINISANGFSM